MKDLTISKIERLNVLNNRFAIEKIQKTLDITGMMFDGEYRFTKKWWPISMKLKKEQLKDILRILVLNYLTMDMFYVKVNA